MRICSKARGCCRLRVGHFTQWVERRETASRRRQRYPGARIQKYIVRRCQLLKPCPRGTIRAGNAVYRTQNDQDIQSVVPSNPRSTLYGAQVARNSTGLSMHKRYFWATLASACLLAGATAADVTVLQHVRIIDGNGGVPLRDATLVLNGERIVSLGNNLRIPAGAHIVDLSGMTAIPGLISDHSHLGMVDGTSANGNNATEANILRQLRQYEAYGVTTVTSLGLNRATFYELQPRLHRGALPGADIFGADRGFGVPAGAPPAAMGILDEQVYRPATPADVATDMQETAARHPALVKLWLDDFHGAMPQKMDPAIYQAVIAQAHRRGLRVAAHVFYLSDAKRLVADGIDILAHGVRDKPVDADFIAAMKAHHVWYVPTLGLDESFFRFAEQPQLAAESLLHHAVQPALAAQFANPEWRAKVTGDAKTMRTNQDALRINLLNAKALFDAGVAIGFGTDSGATPLRIAGYAEHRELVLLTQAGLTPLQAISIATRNASQLLQLTDRGILAAGRLADIVIVSGDPSVDIRATDRIVSVWHRGKAVAGAIETFTP